MRIAGIIMAGLLLAGGCALSQSEQNRTDMFGIASIRIHPVFTRIADWTGDGQPDGIEALVEFADRFEDPTKGSGTVLFELFDYQAGSSDPRGRRVVNPWVASIQSVDEQRAHWNNTTQTYEFQLVWPQVQPSQIYVLTAIFTSDTGERFFGRVVLNGSQETSGAATRSAQ